MASFKVFGSLFFILFLKFSGAVDGRLISSLAKPNPKDAAASARWLVSQNSWGTLSTISVDLKGSPFGNVVSFSDGAPGHGCGVPYFYLTTLDPSARDALKDERSSLTISEVPIGTCGKTDPETPTCAKLTLTGRLKMVDNQSTESEFAEKSLFSKHPEMKTWPKDHGFKIFKLDIEHLFLINWFGGPKPLTPSEYFNYRPSVNALGITSSLPDTADYCKYAVNS